MFLVILFADMCIPGFISYSGYAPCIPCPRGFYQENFQATDCIACDQGSTTVSLNSSSSADCTNDGMKLNLITLYSVVKFLHHS